MAYKKIKEDNGEEAILINGWEKGIAPDPYSGMNRMFNVDLETPGEVAVGYQLTQSTVSGGTLGAPIAKSVRFFTYQTPGEPVGSPSSFAVLDSSGQVFESSSITGTYAFLSSSNSTSTSSDLDGIAHWLGYLFKTRGVNLDYWDGSTWHTAWKTTLTGNVKHYMYVATNNVLYITNGNYLASITAADPNAFVPTDMNTYVYSIIKVRLPVTDMAISLAEVGSGNSLQSTLLIGGQFNAIYPWDKVSSSFALPIYIADSYIKNMVSVNQSVFIFPGNSSGRGRIYITNGSQAEEYFKMPDYTFNYSAVGQDPYYEWGDAIFHRNNLIFGCFVSQNSNTGTVLVGEVFAIDFETKVFRSISSIPSSSGKANATCLMSTYNLTAKGFGYILAWNGDNGTPSFGIGYTGTTAGINNISATINTDLIPIGTLLNKSTNTQVEFKLRSPLQSGESISIFPVVDSVVGSALQFSPTVTTGSISGVAPVNFQGAQWLTFQISLTGNSALSGCRLVELRLR